MTAGTVARPPEVDEGGPGSVWTVVLDALAPSWGRLHSTLLVVAPMLAVLAIWETFRLPEPTIAVFILLIVARGDSVSTMTSSALLSSVIALGAIVAIVVLSLSLSEPALRVPIMAAMTFTTMLLTRATSLGPVMFIFGFFATYGTTEADGLESVGLATGDVTNTEGFGRPQIDYFPPEEALLHALLWLTVVAVLPATILLVMNRVAGRDPRRLLLDKLRARGDAVIGFCERADGGRDRLHAVAREGIAPVLDLVGLAERAHGLGGLHDVDVRLARGLNRLVLLLVAWDMARGAEADGERAFLGGVAGFVGALRERLSVTATTGGAALPLPPQASEERFAGALPSLAAEIRVVLGRLADASDERARLMRADASGPVPKAARPFLQPNGFGAANVKFALKVTLTVMTSYLLESGLDWPGISTCVVTCFFVALGTIGETVHKMTLRIVGCLLGGTLGIGSILLLMPSMTSFGQLAILVGAVAFTSVWVAFGSPRIAYAGWQILLAFGLTTLQGYGPTLDMQTARDRVIGILVGNLVTTLVFAFVWPVRVGDAVRGDLGAAAGTLGKLMELEGTGEPDERRAAEGKLRDGFVASVTRAGGVIPNDRFEPQVGGGHEGRIGRAALERFSRLIVPVSVIATDGVDPSARAEIPVPLRDEVGAYHRAMTAWFDRVAGWIRTGSDRDRIRATLPRAPVLDREMDGLSPELARRVRGRQALYALMERQIGEFLDTALPAGAVANDAGAERTASLAAG